jgi:hypothetical protein
VSTPTKSKRARDQETSRTPPLAPGLPADQHEEELIDEALTETFPASDPISVPVPDDVKERERKHR